MRRLCLAAALAIVVGACGGTASPTGSPVPTASTSPTATAIETAPSALVGAWSRTTQCQELVDRLNAAGLQQWVPEFAVAFVPAAPSGNLADPSRPCEGAVPLMHSHFFTEDGKFGSKDEQGRIVDDGTYRLLDERTFVVSKEFPDVTFHFSITGDGITFEPVIPECAPKCFEAAWSVSVAYQGLSWARVP